MNNLQNPFALLKPRSIPARGEPSFLPLSELNKLIAQHKDCTLVIDLETRGTNPRDMQTGVVGIGVAAHWGTFYSEVKQTQRWDRHWDNFLLSTFEARTPLIAHNVAFDAMWLTYELHRAQGKSDGLADKPDFHNWYACTYAVYRWLACEGFLGQKYGLKQAMVELLGWPESNEAELDQWLVDNKYTMQHGGADKSQMWRAPAEILGKYCWYDAEATYLIWTDILEPVMDNFAVFQSGYREAFMSLIQHVVWQKLRGIYIDGAQLHNYSKELHNECQNLARNFLQSPGVAEAVQQFNKNVIDEHKNAEPKQYKKMPELGAEPQRYKKDGKQSKTWEKWEEKRQSLETLVPEITIPWRKWHEKHTKMVRFAESGELSPEVKELGLFNMDSAKHKQWLFYTGLGHEVINTTDSGEPAVDEDALLLLKPQGPMLIAYNERNKLQSMVSGCLSKIETGFLHVGLKCPGTYTGRLGGADGLNVQNVPKDKGYLSCWKASPGCKLVIFDIASLEPHVLALASGDPTLMRLYGPESTGWDCVYLSVGARLGGRVGDTIRAAGYDPLSNTKESVSKAKKEAKDARQIAKVVHLACIAEGTLIRVKDKGFKPIETVQVGEFVWDGEEWVTHEGPVLQGTKTCVTLSGEALTPDHKVLTKEDWNAAEETNPSQLIRPKQPSASWSDVWAMVRSICRSLKGC